MAYVLMALFFLVVGFAFGRIKNRARLAAVQDELKVVEAKAASLEKVIVADVKAKLGFTPKSN